MGFFTLIIIVVLIATLGEVASKVLGPLASKLADLLGEMAQDRRLRRETGARGETLPPAVVQDLEEHLERRLARIEERVDFIEALRAPESPPALGGRGDPPRASSSDPV